MMLTLDQLRAYIHEYAATFDETVVTRIDSERLLNWIKAKIDQDSGEAATHAEAQAAQAEMAPADAYQPSEAAAS